MHRLLCVLLLTLLLALGYIYTLELASNYAAHMALALLTVWNPLAQSRLNKIERERERRELREAATERVQVQCRLDGWGRAAEDEDTGKKRRMLHCVPPERYHPLFLIIFNKKKNITLALPLRKGTVTPQHVECVIVYCTRYHLTRRTHRIK